MRKLAFYTVYESVQTLVVVATFVVVGFTIFTQLKRVEPHHLGIAYAGALVAHLAMTGAKYQLASALLERR